MHEPQLAALLGITIIFIQVVAGFIVNFRKKQLRLPPPVVILICGPHLSCKSILARLVQDRFRNALRPFLHASSKEFVERISSKLRPTMADDAALNIGDPLFDAWFYARDYDGSYTLKLAERGARSVSGIHRSWAQLLEAGNNLVIDYSLMEESQLQDLLTVFKKQLGSKLAGLLVIDLQVGLSELLESEASTHTDHPIGFARCSHRLHASLAFPNYVSKFVCQVPRGIDTETLTDTVFKYVSQSGLV